MRNSFRDQVAANRSDGILIKPLSRHAVLTTVNILYNQFTPHFFFLSVRTNVVGEETDGTKLNILTVLRQPRHERNA